MKELPINAISTAIIAGNIFGSPDTEIAIQQLGALVDELIKRGIDRDKWRNIAGNLYDEMRLRGADCLYRHEDATNDCMNDYELADGLAERGDKQ